MIRFFFSSKTLPSLVGIMGDEDAQLLEATTCDPGEVSSGNRVAYLVDRSSIRAVRYASNSGSVYRRLWERGRPLPLLWRGRDGLPTT
jgi:hypothetical protein